MELVLDRAFLEDLTFWAASEPRTLIRIFRLLEEIRRDPFGRTGKPEPLKGLGAGVWSRRITEEHRLVYRMDAGRVYLLQCRFHY
jgi:toxin YoeB